MAISNIQEHFERAVSFHRTGQLNEAAQLYLQIVAQQPTHTPSLYNLSLVAYSSGKCQLAADSMRQAIALDPTLPNAHNILGAALKELGQIDQAISAYRLAISSNPNFALAHSNLGAALQAANQLEPAIDAYQQAIRIEPALFNAHYNLGLALEKVGKLNEAIDSHRKAVALQPDHAMAHNNLGNAFEAVGRLDEAVAEYDRALALNPSLPEAHFNLALARLLRGDLSRGLEGYEWRWKTIGFPSPQRNFSQPLWEGSRLDDCTLLLHAEQGVGDAIQFLRYVPLVAERVGKIVIECQPDLHRLIRGMKIDCQLLSQGQLLPPFDVHCPLPSLPLAFGTTLESIPSKVPYLVADPAIIESWRDRLSVHAGVKKVALAWAGNPEFKKDRFRSLSLDRLAPLADVPGVTFYSVQKGYAQSQADHPPAGLALINLGPHLRDFSDTAAVMSLMDLVITTDTSVAHLAGALGRPAWLMLQYAADWRWLQNRSDSPWYPTMRLFRQPAFGDWDSIIRQVAEKLREA